MTNSNTQHENSTITSKQPRLQLITTLLTSLSGVILAVLPLTLNSHSSRVAICASQQRFAIAVHTQVSPSNQEYKAFISIRLSTSKPLLPDNKILLP